MDPQSVGQTGQFPHFGRLIPCSTRFVSQPKSCGIKYFKSQPRGDKSFVDLGWSDQIFNFFAVTLARRCRLRSFLKSLDVFKENPRDKLLWKKNCLIEIAIFIVGKRRPSRCLSSLQRPFRYGGVFRKIFAHFFFWSPQIHLSGLTAAFCSATRTGASAGTRSAM